MVDRAWSAFAIAITAKEVDPRSRSFRHRVLNLLLGIIIVKIYEVRITEIMGTRCLGCGRRSFRNVKLSRKFLTFKDWSNGEDLFGSEIGIV